MFMPAGGTQWIVEVGIYLYINSGIRLIKSLRFCDVLERFYGWVGGIQGLVLIGIDHETRVLVFMAPLSSSEAASLVIGQPDFTSKHCNRGRNIPAADTLCGPKGLTLDASGNLWVAEDDNSRVLEYNDPLHSGSPDISADLVYGEPNFSSVACALGPNGVCHPDHVAIGRSGQLLISDGDNNRLLVIDDSLTNSTANAVIGQPDFNSNTPATSASGLSGPKGITVDAKENLYVTDEDNNRLLRFNKAE
ncbi:MAG: hypothetical protein DMG97_16650 [Acidobacteria bacterium]|nr:MAG: hypothetical protein DMG97_16650 [Acidobacteriota bacterium]